MSTGILQFIKFEITLEHLGYCERVSRDNAVFYLLALIGVFIFWYIETMFQHIKYLKGHSNGQFVRISL
jgi:hypothetical protein